MTLRYWSFMRKVHVPQVRFWLMWGLAACLLLYGIHRYFEYRNAELDKRLRNIEHTAIGSIASYAVSAITTSAQLWTTAGSGAGEDRICL